MSGTTITAEERAQWLSEAQPKNIDYYEPIDFELDKRIRKLIGALEQAEASAEKAEKELAGADAEISELRDELEDSRGTEKDAPNILCAIARLVGVYEHSQELGDDMGTLVFEAVSDLLAEKQKYAPRALRWTHEPPKVAGWYFQRAMGKEKTQRIAFVSATLSGLHCKCGCSSRPLAHWVEFEWAGPITPPID